MPSSEFDPLTSSAPLIVYLDCKSPYAYLAVEPTIAMADELGIAVDWRPFTLDIPSYLGSARLNKEGKVVEQQRTAGQWTAVKYAYHDVRRYGSMRGVVVRGTVKIWDSSLAGIGMLWAKALGEPAFRAYARRLYERFWKRELDIEDVTVIERVLDEAGVRTHGFREYASGEGRALHDAIQTRAFDAGIFGVPTYIVGGERFFGREHLPRIRWILTGRAGAPPDIAYEAPTVERAAPAEVVAARSLAVVIDFKSPYAWLALAPTCAMAAELGITIDWIPMVLAPSSRTDWPAGNDRATRHQQFRAAYLENNLVRYAADRGLPLNALHRKSDSTLASIGLLWAKRHGTAQEYVRKVFERYWRDEVDLADERFIESCLAEAGVSASGFSSFAQGEGREEIARLQAQLRDRGIFDVPTYILNDDLFLGRQHLPLLRAQLTSA